MKKSKLDNYSRHEALDRAHLLASMVGDWLLSHPYIAADKKLKKRAKVAMRELAQLYQDIGLGDGEAGA